MFGFGALGTKIAIAGIIVAVISASIGGFFLYQKSVVSELQDQIDDRDETISEQQEQISGLFLDNEKLTISNTSLESEISRKSEETKEAFAELSRLREKDAESSTRLLKVERILRDKNRLDRLDAIRNTRAASSLLRRMNNNIKCYIEHFNEVNGRCIVGEWVKDGERRVPKAKEEGK